MMRTTPSISVHAAEEVTRFGREVGIDLQLDETGNCYFEHQNGLRMAIMLTGDDQIVTAAALFSEVNINENQIADILTEFNWLGTRARGATLSWNPQAKNFLLWYSRDANVIRTDELSELLTRLLSTAHMLEPELAARIFGADTKKDGEEKPQPPGWIAQRA